MSYIRTSAGTAAVLNPKISMPRQLKALLIAMNGRFDPHFYESRMPGVLNMADMLETLIKEGYARALPDSDGQTVGPVDTEPAPLTALLQPADPRQVQDAVAEMTDFVMQNLPNEALEISFALESLNSIAQLEASLGDYEAKIRHLDVAAIQHLAKLKQILRHR